MSPGDRSSPRDDETVGRRESKLTSDRDPTDLEAEGELPPVVARMVVEIRSDGTKTIARGALEDLQSGERVSLQADARTPFELAAQLSRSLAQMPLLARSLAGEAALDLAKKPIEKLRQRLKPLTDWGEKTGRLRRKAGSSSRSGPPGSEDD